MIVWTFSHQLRRQFALSAKDRTVAVFGETDFPSRHKHWEWSTGVVDGCQKLKFSRCPMLTQGSEN